MKCYFCTQQITGLVEQHHPGCHTRYHSEAGHFKEWGGWTTYKGRPGYERALAKYPGFHSMGGQARAHTAHRDERGRFTRGTQ